jgi:hypothetical protein
VKKRSPLSTLLLIVVIAAAAYAGYRWVYQPMIAKQTMEQAMEKGCEAVAQQFEGQKEEITEDLMKFLENIEQQEKIEAAAAQESPEEAAK